MKTNDPDDFGPALRMLLKEWKPQQSLPPRFQESVWRRIARADTAPASTVSFGAALADWFATMLPRPAIATAYVTALLAVGVGLGFSQARQETTRITGDLGARYAQAVDPYQANSTP